MWIRLDRPGRVWNCEPNHQTFTKAFTAAFGLTPEKYRSVPIHLLQFAKPDLLLEYTMVDEGLFLYFVGAEAEDSTRAETSGQCAAWELPPNDYVVCTFEAETFTDLVGPAISNALRYLFETWLPGHGLTSQSFSAEKYLTDVKVSSVEVWVIPVALSQMFEIRCCRGRVDFGISRPYHLRPVEVD